MFMNFLADKEAIEEAVGVSLALERATKFSSKVAKRSEYLPPENLLRQQEHQQRYSLDFLTFTRI